MGAFIRAIDIFFDLLQILIIIRVFMNIFRISFSNPIGNIIYQLTEPIIVPARSILNKIGLDKIMIDFSPWIALLLLWLAHWAIIEVVKMII